MFELPTGGEYVALFKAIEGTILQQCLEHRTVWFKDSATEETLVAAFKSFVDGKSLKVRIADDVMAFDERKDHTDPADIPAGTHVRVVMELSRACFGKTTFGAMWRLLQIQALPRLACLFKEDDGENVVVPAPPQDIAIVDDDAETQEKGSVVDVDDTPDAREFS
jgi:hypothetical protein